MLNIKSAQLRTRSILHITVGEPNVWEPTEKELEDIAKMFKQALPDIEVIATRDSVIPSVVVIQDDTKPGIFSRMWSRLF